MDIFLFFLPFELEFKHTQKFQIHYLKWFQDIKTKRDLYLRHINI